MIEILCESLSQLSDYCKKSDSSYLLFKLKYETKWKPIRSGWATVTSEFHCIYCFCEITANAKEYRLCYQTFILKKGEDKRTIIKQICSDIENIIEGDYTLSFQME